MHTLVDVLRGQAAARALSSAFTYLQNGETPSAQLTFAELDRRARAIASALQGAGMQGERALMLYPPGLDFITGFFGCLYAGAIAVPAYPPKANQNFSRLQSIVRDAEPRLALTTSSLIENLTLRAEATAELPAFEWMATDACSDGGATAWTPPAIQDDTLALLQYTSGSTGHAKGVMVTHANMLHNLEGQRVVWDCTPESVMVTWLPAFHDLGLVFGLLQPVYAGFPCYMMSPAAFLQRPFRWLQAMSRHRATHTSAPNFAYELCAAKVTETERDALDLSSVHYAMIAAEPIREQTVRRFQDVFGPRGFRPQACCPGYGLAEGTLAVTCVDPHTRPTIDHVDGDRLGMNRVVDAVPGEPSVAIVGCGYEHPGVNVSIVDPETLTECADGAVGEVWVGGASIARGYWRKPEETAATFGARLATGAGPFLRTGDLGFVRSRQLFITGRLKDLVIIRGQNHYPQDIELTVEQSHPAMRASSSAAFSIPHAGEERLIIVAEVERTAVRTLDVDDVVAEMRRAVSERHDLQPYAITLVKPASILKTSSGKIQRRACRAAFLAGEFHAVGVWRQELSGERAPATARTSRSPDEIRAWLIDRVAAVCAVRRQDVDPAQSFSRYGMDSLGAVTLTADLEDWLGRPMPVTLAYDYPTVAALIRFLSPAGQPAGSVRLQPDRDVRRSDTRRDPIAIVGMACRFPRADTPEAFWELLRQGVDAVSEWPADRRALEVGSESLASSGDARTRWGGFVENVDRFDAAFFGISPREAVSIDPQQRLLLEIVWEALERGGIAPASLARSRTGVFVGISGNDYSRLQHRAGAGTDAWSGTGGAMSIAANRLSYLLDLRGPSVAVDTACSSSLVAVHLACQSLRLGESAFAIAAGVNLILSFEWSRIFSEAQMLAPDGRCKAFDASADGYVRGEGCGALLLKPLEAARADGDSILAIVRGTAVNQDGRSHGLTAPNGPAQIEVIARALADAGVEPGDISYIEAHGTGTALGDPIEAGAIGSVFSDRRRQPLLVGSVKTNIGHAEAAAGIAGLIKVVLAMQHREIPPNLHFRSLNTGIPAQSPIRVPTSLTPWRDRGVPVYAGVSSFGFGGTNAHIVVEGPSLDVGSKPADVEAPFGRLLVLSAPTASALRALASHYRGVDGPLAAVCATAAIGRNHFPARLAVQADSIEDLRARLTAFAGGTADPGSAAQARGGWWTGVRETLDEPPIAFLYTGQGAQYWGMGRDLAARSTVFRTALEEAAAALDSHVDVPLHDLLFAERGRALIDRTEYGQPALFAIECATAALWRSLGITPHLVIGHSVGEYAAAVTAGVMTLAAAARLVAERGRLMQQQAPGSMAAVLAGAEDVRRALGADPDVEIAAVNGPANVVVSGAAPALERALERFARAGLKARALTVSHAFHSAMMEPMLPAFGRLAASVQFQAPQRLLISTMTGGEGGADLATAAYWSSQIRRPVRFADAIQRAWSKGYRTFVEVGPDATLSAMAQQVMADAEKGVWAATLRRGRREVDVVREAAARVFVAGGSVDWRAWDPETRQRCVLPTYPFERQRFWIESTTGDRPPLDVQVRWEPVELPDESGAAPAGDGPWVLFTDKDGIGERVAAVLRDRGDRVITVTASAGYHQRDGRFEIDPADAGQFSRVLDESAGLAGARGLVYLWGLDAAPPPSVRWERSAVDACLGLVQVTKALTRHAVRLPVWVVTRCAMAVVDTDRDTHLDQAPLWGLGKVLAVEYPGLWGGLIDLDVPGAEVTTLVRAMGRPGAEDHLAIRRGRAYAPRLEAIDPPSSVAAPRIRADATYLITGGTGALGLVIATHLVSRGARSLVLVSRHGGEFEPTRAAIDAMAQAGADVRVMRADVAVASELETVMANIRRALPPLGGVVHAAGVLDDGILINLNRERFARVFRSKSVGAWNLHQATTNIALDFFVLFSSAAALVGSSGQANYVAASVFLDALAFARNRAGLPAVSINWGVWEGDGLGARVDERHRERLAALGFTPLRQEEALQAFDRALGRAGQVGVVRADWPAFAAAHPRQSLVRPFRARQVSRASASPAAGWFRDQLAGAARLDRVGVLTRLVAQQAAEVLRSDVDRVSMSRGFFDQGMDSLLAMQLKSRLETALDLPLPATITFDHPTPEKLGEYLASLTSVDAKRRRAPVPSVAPERGVRPHLDEPIAIVGIGCRFPGGGSSPDAFWRFLRSGGDAVTEFPRDRWDVDRYYDPNRDRAGKICTRQGSFLDRVDGFDAAFFEISPREAESLDPQQRLLLEVAWEALEQGAHSPDRLRETRTGVFVGIGQFDYARRRLMSSAVDRIGPYDGTGNGLSFAAGRISYVLGLQGPTVAIDTACSSSLVSLHLACQSLRLGECDAALAGGVQLMLSPEVSVFLSRAGALSPDGRCRTFDAGANGYGRGEGCGMLVLKRLSDATRDNDPIAAVIRSSAVNHDGPSSGLTVPSAAAQDRLIRAALDRAALDPDDIDYVEAHGTGTALGDPIEISGLAGVFGSRAAGREPLRLGCVKTNVGHLEAAAGIAGVIKVVLALQHESIPPHLHCHKPNPSVPWRSLPFAVTTKAEPWAAGERVRRAGVSSFGISGTNAHVILEEAPPVAGDGREIALGPFLLPLSARTDAALAALARAYADHLTEHIEQPVDVFAWTMQVGRAELTERAAVIGGDRAELIARLRAVGRGDSGDGIVRGRASGQSATRSVLTVPEGDRRRRDALERVMSAWTTGAAVDWASIGGTTQMPRVALPTYAWERQRFWLEFDDDRPRGGQDASRGGALGLRRRSSPVPRAEIDFETTLAPTDALVAEHRVFGAAVLPASACLELALAAAHGVRATERHAIAECRFVSPVLVENAVSLRLVLVPRAAGEFSFDLYGAASSDDSMWTHHASGRIVPRRHEGSPAIDIAALQARLPKTSTPARVYATLAQRGIALGPAFRVLGDIVSGEREALSRLVTRANAAYAIDPALVDGCSALHAVLDDAPDTRIQVALAGVTLDESLADACWAYVRRDGDEGALSILDARGRVLFSIASQQFERASAFHRRSARRDSLYEVVWTPTPAVTGSFDTSTLAADTRRALQTAASVEHRAADERLEGVAVEFILVAFDRLGRGAPLPSRFTAETLAAAFAIPAKHHRLLARLLDILGDAGRLVAESGAWIANVSRERRDPEAVARDIARQHPIAAVECELLSRCGGQLAAVLQGTCDPLPLLFPGHQNTVSAASLYRDSHVARVMNGLVTAAVSSFVASRAVGARLRVLEIGAGTGATADAVVDSLPAHADYWFTDVSSAFIQQARLRYRDRSNVSYARFDIELAPDAQEIPTETFDLVIASNVLHATRSIADTLAHVRQLLSPGGSLLLVEGTTPRRWVDLVFGLTDGWWRYADGDVRSHPLLSVPRWTECLERAGFTGVVAVPDSAADSLAGQSLLLASVQSKAAAAEWLVVGDDGFSRGLVAALQSHGGRSEAVSPAALPDRLREASAGDRRVVRCLSGPSGQGALAGRAVAHAQDAIALVQAIARSAVACRLWFVTDDGVELAPVSGIAKTFALESPQRWGGLIHVDEGSRARGASHVARELLTADRRDDEVAFRQDARWVPRLQPVAMTPREDGPLGGGAWIITGGLGAFGLATAEYLARAGVQDLCLVSRRGLAGAGAAEAVGRLRGLGASVSVVSADVTDEPAMAAILRSYSSSGRALTGIVHAAGETGYSLLEDVTPEAAAKILRPKIEGAWILHRLTRDLDLRYFVCYSSMVSVWGARGQAPYVAANHFLDALAHHRVALNLPAMAINWGPQTGGMLPPEMVGELQQMGIGTAAMTVAVEVLDRVLARTAAQAVVVDIDWARFLALYRTRRSCSFFERVETTGPAVVPAGAVDGRALVLGTVESERRSVLLDRLASLLSAVVHARGHIDTTAGFFDLGLDSLGAMEMRRSLEQQYGLALPSTVLFDYPTLDALTEFVLEQLTGHTTATPADRSIDALSEQELEELLLRKLEEIA